MQLVISLLALVQGGILPDTPDWTREGTDPFQRLGLHVANAGDVNGDGRDDLLVSSPGVSQQNGVHGAGKVELFFGTASGHASTPAWTLRGAASTSTSVATTASGDVAGIGDVNGDGYDDVAATEFLTISTHNLHVYYGGPSGPSGGGEVAVTESDWRIEGGNWVEWLGSAILGPGDLNGDGVDDLVVGARYFGAPGLGAQGAVFVFLGSTGAGLPNGPLATVDDAHWSVVSNRSQGQIGRRLHAVGDVNGDGTPDFAATGDGAAGDVNLYRRHWVFTNVNGGRMQDATQACFASLQVPGIYQGYDIAAGDFDRDGYSDVVLATPGRNVAGLIEPLIMHLGGPSGFTRSPWTNSSAWYYRRGDALEAADFDADGFVDLAVLSSTAAPQPYGRVQVLRGTGLRHQPFDFAAAWEVSLTSVSTGLTAELEVVGDPNLDLTPSLAICEHMSNVNGVSQTGRVRVFSNEQEPVDQCPVATPDWSFVHPGSETTLPEVQLADVDGDGFDDAVVCRRRTSPDVRIFRGTAAGLHVNPSWVLDVPDPESSRGIVPVAKGDVDGDGFEDVLLLRRGRFYFAPSGLGSYMPGAAYLMRGSASGPAITWSATQSSTDPIEFASAGELLDFDGDGLDDIVLSARGHERDLFEPQNDPYEIPGQVFVYRGATLGAVDDETTAEWTASDQDSTGSFGWYVRNGGDLDADGREELVAFAPFTRNNHGQFKGVTYLWKGRDLTSAAAGTPMNADWRLSAVSSGEPLHPQVLSAGVDVTGDDVPDLLVARGSSAPVEVQVWSGHAGGFLQHPVTFDGFPSPRISMIDDFTGDGVGDLVTDELVDNVRMPLDGRVGVVHGGVYLSSQLERWRAAGGRPRAQMRSTYFHPVRGDVNGDGLSDILCVSKWYVASPSENLARVTCYHGTGRPILEVESTTVATGDSVYVGHFGGLESSPVYFLPELPAGPGSLGARLIWARGSTDSTCCWHTQWYVDPRIPTGTYRVRTLHPGGPRRFWSDAIDVVVQ